MSERGVFAVDRGVWDHDVLAENEPYSRREAWLWLVSEAAWKPHKRRIIGRTIELARGQFAGSLRFIASKWRWTEPRVRRFLHALISAEMVDAKTDAGVTVITICKYEEYQRVSLPTDATRENDDDAPPTQERRKVEDKESKEVSSLRSDSARKRGTRLPDMWEPSLEDLNEACRKLGVSGTQEELNKFRDYWKAQPGQRGTKLDWDATFRNWIRNAKGPANGRRTVHDAANDLLAKVRAFDEPAPGSLCDREGEGPIRLVSPR